MVAMQTFLNTRGDVIRYPGEAVVLHFVEKDEEGEIIDNHAMSRTFAVPSKDFTTPLVVDPTNATGLMVTVLPEIVDGLLDQNGFCEYSILDTDAIAPVSLLSAIIRKA